MTDEEYMKIALQEAQEAYNNDEVPIGAIIVYNDEVLCKAYNRKEESNNSLMHAEMQVLDMAQKLLHSKYLQECKMYVTIEPCAMCTGAIINARLGELIYAAREPKTGCCGSMYNLLEDNKFNHKVIQKSGVLEEEARKLMQDFFLMKR